MGVWIHKLNLFIFFVGLFMFLVVAQWSEKAANWVLFGGFGFLFFWWWVGLLACDLFGRFSRDTTTSGNYDPTVDNE